MTDIVKVDISPASALRIMRAIDDRQETWSLDALPPKMSSHGALCTSFVLQNEGAHTATEVHLSADGTWTATSAVTIDDQHEKMEEAVQIIKALCGESLHRSGSTTYAAGIRFLNSVKS